MVKQQESKETTDTEKLLFPNQYWHKAKGKLYKRFKEHPKTRMSDEDRKECRKQAQKRYYDKVKKGREQRDFDDY